MNRFMLIDGNSIINRAYFGQGTSGQLTSPDGTPTGAVYTFLTMLLRYMDEYDPTHMAVCFDRPEPTFRHEKYTEYKANRTGMDDDLAVQMPILKSCLEAMNIFSYEKISYEADDLIGTMAKKFSNQSHVYILSGDRDDFQLLTDKVSQIYPQSRGQTTLFTPESLEEKYQLRPDQVVDFKALMGDSSDNIPGVKGVGEKTALKLLLEFDTLDNLYQNTDKLKGAVKKRIEEGKDLAYLSQELAKIDCDVPLDFDFEQLEIQAWDKSRLQEQFKALGFQSFIKRFKLDESDEGADSKIPSWSLHRTTINSIDYDSFSHADLYYYLVSSDESWTLALAKEVDKKIGIYLFDETSIDRIRACTETLHQNHAILHAFQWKEMLKNLDFYPLTNLVDTQVAAYLAGFESHNKDIEQMYQLVMGQTLYSPDSVMKTAKNDGLSETEVLTISFLLAQVEVEKKLETLLIEREIIGLAHEIEFPLVALLAKMERQGITVDSKILEDLGEDFRSQIAGLEHKIYDAAGREFNISSPKQLGEVLFEDLEIKSVKKTSTGNYSTAASELEKLSAFYPIVEDVLNYRRLTKLESTYVQGLLKEIQEDGKIHTSFNHTLTSTGRLSSADPNLQNIPAKEEEGRQIRKAFIASEGCIFIDADYSQIELRLLAALSEDKELMDAFLHDGDIHRRTAASIFSKDASDVTPAERNAAKTVNFSIVYGISDFGLSEDLKITRKEAKEYIDGYHRLYANVKPYMDGLIEFAHEHGYVTTLFGRRRYIPELKAKNHNVRKFGERAAMNAPVQGTAADIIKLAMINTEKAFRAENIQAQIIIQVHDELLVECAIDEKEKAMEILQREMENAAKLPVPLKVEIQAAKNWFESK